MKPNKTDSEKKHLLSVGLYSVTIALALFFSHIPLILCGQDLNRPPLESEINYSPADGDVSPTNPPAFIWLPAEGVSHYILQLSSSESFESGKTITVRDIDITVHIPAEIFKPGKWFWRFGHEKDGTERFSRIRSFEIPVKAVIFPFITADEVISRIPKTRPRINYSPEQVEAIRQDSEGRFAHVTENVVEDAEKILVMHEPLFEEPAPWNESEDPRMAYVNAWRNMRPYTQRMVTSALAYLYTGDERFANEAKRRLMHFMEWDIDGTSTCVAGNDELGMDIAANSPPVFDWIYPVLSEEERRKCTEVLAARMHQISYDAHRARNMETRPFDSHKYRMIRHVIEGSIVLAHDVPEVSDWLNYTLKLIWGYYPAWGISDGGYHEGVPYWRSYMSGIVRFVAELNRLGIPFRNKPFFQNTGYFGIYAAHPSRPARSFGDSHETPVSRAEGELMYKFASLYNNPYFLWYANHFGVHYIAGREAFLFPEPSTRAKAPVDLPQSHAFNDVGVVAMHSDMSTPANNVTLIFQSNPFGAISHNYACQNAFVIEAYGEPLAISTGTRQTHGVPHHREWIWHTKAHNSILVDNEGQETRKRNASGKIIHYEDEGEYVYTTGDATAAYGGRLEKFHRHVLFIRPDYFIIIDDLKTSGSLSTFQWLLHSPTEIRVDRKNHIMENSSGNARLTSRFLIPDDLDYIQHSGFTPQVQDSTRWQNQFHLTASTQKPSLSKQFVTIMRVDKTSGAPAIKPDPPSTPRQTIAIKNIDTPAATDKVLLNARLLDANGGIAIHLGDDLILWRDQDSWKVETEGVISTRQMEVKRGFFKEK
jgi:hypothetical protein